MREVKIAPVQGNFRHRHYMKFVDLLTRDVNCVPVTQSLSTER